MESGNRIPSGEQTAVPGDIYHGPRIAGVGFPAAIPGIFDYRIPDVFAGRIAPGTPVLVSVKSREMWGVAVELKEHSLHSLLKEIIDIREERWTDSNQSLIALYKWIASYYQCELGVVFRPIVRKKLLQTNARFLFTYRMSGPTSATLTDKESAALDRIRVSGDRSLTSRRLCDELRIAPATLGSLCRKGALVKEKTEFVRDADELLQEPFEDMPRLTEEQQAVFAMMRGDLDAPDRPWLLHGITGSGKTFIYIELAKAALAAGKGVIILVPEISLTPQTIRRFKSALGDVITVMHSRMSDGERRDSLEQLVTGAKRLVVGARSAILAPLENLGLIIVDEEHDQSYKQAEMDPRYHARDVAVMRGRLQKALVVLGSATPSIESHYNARTGKYRLACLTKRVGAARLPEVSIVDMNAEHRDNNWGLMSRALQARIQTTLDTGRQVILLLNRRGFAVSLICKECGHTHVCPDCSVKLTYHRADASLKCHQCGRREPAPSVCPACRGEQIRYKGTAIQKAEEYLRAQFPQARIVRMDQDTTRRKGSHATILDGFLRREADVLLGTQMVAKGLNFPGVALVGVLQADLGLHIPDFRSSERTYQLLSQVAGRAGREDDQGEVVIQTYFPHEHSVLAAQAHDYETFYEKEIRDREPLSYPPFGRLARIVVHGADETAVAERCRELSRVGRARPSSAVILGPSPAILTKLKSEFRWSLLLKAKSHAALQPLLDDIRRAAAKFPKTIRTMIDVDPANMI